ncbi:hypothetical protein V8F33_012323 [Rhypophila sp. PSN 637]
MAALRNRPDHQHLDEAQIRRLAEQAIANGIALGRRNRGGQGAAEGEEDGDDPNAARSRYSSYNRALWINQFPNILTLNDRWKESPRTWLNMGPIMAGLKKTTTINDYFHLRRGPGIRNVVKGSGKVRAVKAILRTALADDGESVINPTAPAYKKHVIIFTASPGEGAVLAADLRDRHENEWRVEWVTDGASAAKITEDSEIFPDIPFIDSGPDNRPTVLIGTTQVLGTGLNGLSRCKYGVLFRLPWSEVEEAQAQGRLHRAGQRYLVEWFTLLGTDGPFETMIWDRHKKRSEVLGQFIGGAEDQAEPAEFTAAPTNPPSSAPLRSTTITTTTSSTTMTVIAIE